MNDRFTTKDIELFKIQLTELSQECQEGIDSPSSEAGAVELDQNSVGRISRIDALSRQQMALAAKRRLGVMLSRATAALARLEQGEFGECQHCGEEIPIARLRKSPTVLFCIECQQEKES